MLFLAITLGFFAENYREHKVIEHKMTQNYIALIYDLDSYSSRYYFYDDILHRIIKMNSDLSKRLKNIQH
jgi:hypothetical protein